jgi:hypothetical protein
MQGSKTIIPKVSVVRYVNDFQKYKYCIGSFFSTSKNGTLKLIPIDNNSSRLSVKFLAISVNEYKRAKKHRNGANVYRTQ